MKRVTKLFIAIWSRAVQLLNLSPHPSSWTDYLTNSPIAPVDFLSQIDKLPVQERDTK